MIGKEQHTAKVVMPCSAYRPPMHFDYIVLGNNSGLTSYKDLAMIVDNSLAIFRGKKQISFTQDYSY